MNLFSVAELYWAGPALLGAKVKYRSTNICAVTAQHSHKTRAVVVLYCYIASVVQSVRY
jgi:hypothetical protein